MSKSTLKILPALMVAITALVTQPVFGEIPAPNMLVITENSSTSLTAILNGTTSLTVNPSGADLWSIDLGAPVSGVAHFWTEPDAAGFVNVVFSEPGLPNRLFVQSDFEHSGGIADGTPDTTSFTLNGQILSVTFKDLGDIATVPDTGTSFSLFGLSLMGLGFLRRKLC